MSASQYQNDLIFIGPLPPPVHGQSVATERMAKVLQSAGAKLQMIDSGPGESGGVFRRLFNAVRASVCVLFSKRQVVYLSVNANRGLLITIVICASARLRRMTIALHHHSYRYIGSSDWMMSVLGRVAGAETLHIVNCRRMAKELSSRYPHARMTQSYSNVGVVSDDLVPSPTIVNYAMGHMSNLTEAKGLGRTIDAFRDARKIWPKLKLNVAGPCSDAVSESQVTAAQAEFGDAFVYHGAVYGDQKKAFFDSIDVFVFPSLYAVETQGIVNLEALACGVPVVAFSQCCIPEDIGESGGSAVAKTEDFSAALCAYFEKFLQDPRQASEEARKRFLQIQSTHQVEEASLLQSLKLRGANVCESL